MSVQSSLSRRAAEGLRRLAGREPSPSSEAFPGTPPEEGLICLTCSYVNPPTASFCSQCGHNLDVPVDGDVPGYLRAVDLLRSGDLPEAEVRSLLERLQRECVFYTVGTRYSVFGQQAVSDARLKGVEQQ